MKKTLLTLAAVAALSGGLLSATSQAEAAPRHGHHWGHGGHSGHGGWRNPRPWAPGPWAAGYGGGYWGGYRIYTRPVALYADEDCEWVRVRTPYGPRWRNLCG